MSGRIDGLMKRPSVRIAAQPEKRSPAHQTAGTGLREETLKIAELLVAAVASTATLVPAASTAAAVVMTTAAAVTTATVTAAAITAARSRRFATRSLTESGRALDGPLHRALPHDGRADPHRFRRGRAISGIPIN